MRSAAVFEGEHLTYQELNVRANQLARYLQKLGCETRGAGGNLRGTVTRFCVGILGILKAGGAYVPLDLAYPPERLALFCRMLRCQSY
jgi:non-ribosomal peptide synthetase component F